MLCAFVLVRMLNMLYIMGKNILVYVWLLKYKADHNLSWPLVGNNMMRNSLLDVIFLTLTLSMLHVSSASASTESIIKNGDFEKGGVESIAENWIDNSGWADVDVRYQKVFSQERKSLVQRITCQRFRHGAVQFIQKGVDLRSGSTYRVKFWAKGKLESPLEVLFRKQGKPYTTYDSKAFRITDEWREYDFDLSVRTDDSASYFMFKFASKGELSLDDITVEPVASLKTKIKYSKDNKVSNGNFEVGTDKWGVEYRGINYNYEMYVRALELQPQIDATRAKYGNNSIKIPSSGKAKFHFNSEYIILQPNVSYTLSMWVYSDSERTLRIGIKSGYFGRSAETMNAIRVGPEWRRYEMTTTLKPSKENSFLYSKGKCCC